MSVVKRSSSSPYQEGSVDDYDDAETAPLKADSQHGHLGILHLLALNSFMCPYSMVNLTMGIITIPKEAQIMFPDQPAAITGVLMGVCGITQLISPLCGYLSDNSTSSYGRRKSFIITGSAIMLVGFAGLWASRNVQNIVGYAASLFVSTCGLNIAFAAYTALNPDMVPASQVGLASGIMGMIALFGSCMAMVLLGLVFEDISCAYPIYMTATVVCAGLTCIAVGQEKNKRETFELTMEDVKECYRIGPESHGDFFWVFVIRTFYYLSLSIQAFFLFYLRDVLGAKHPKEPLAVIVVLGQVAGALVSAPIGKLSDTIGFKKLVIASCIMIGAVYAGFIAVILDPRLDFVYMLGLLFGVANGAFLAVDYALACDVLVNKDEIGRDMGLWGVGAFVGTTLGPIILGPMLQSYSIMDADGKVTAFGDQGYVLVFTFGIVNITIAALLVSKIKGSR